MATGKVEDLTAEVQKTVEENVGKVAQGLEGATKAGQENVDALMASSKIAAKAFEDINAEVMAYTKKSCEDGMVAAKELATCKSVTEYVEKQGEIARDAFNGLVGETVKLNEMYSAAVKEAFAPINDRIGAANETMKAFRA